MQEVVAPKTCISSINDVIFSLKSLSIQALSIDQVESAGRSFPNDLLHEYLRWCDLTRVSHYYDKSSQYWKTKKMLLDREEPFVEFLWPSPYEINSLFYGKSNAFLHLRELHLFGCEHLPLAHIVESVPMLEKLSLRAVEADVLYSPLAKLTSLTSLTINSCAQAFSAIGDGRHSPWLQELTSLTELDLRHSHVTTPMLRALPYLNRLRLLDVSMTLAHDAFVVLANAMPALETAVVGDDSCTDMSQLYLVPDVPLTAYPSLKSLTVFVPINARDPTLDKLRELCDPFFSWCKRHASLERGVVCFETGMQAFVPEVEEEHNCDNGKKLMTMMRLHPISFDISNDLLLSARVYHIGWALHVQAEAEGGVIERAWVANVWKDLLTAFFYWRHCPSQFRSIKSVLSTITSMMVLLVRWDHATNFEMNGVSHAMCRSLTNLEVAPSFFTLLRDAVSWSKKTAENTDERSPSRHMIALIMRLLTWAYDVSDLLVQRSVQASLILSIDAHLRVAEAMQDTAEALQPGMVLYSQLSSSQPLKGRLLTPIEGTLLHILDSKTQALPALREAALTCLGNLASHPPNTVKLVTEHPEVLEHLLDLLNDAESPYGAAYLSGNLSYISPTLVGAPFYRNPEFRKRLAALTSTSLNSNNQVSCFWTLWARCHSRGSFIEVFGYAVDQYAEDDRSLSADLLTFAQRFTAKDTIPCLWSNLQGVRRLLTARLACVRGFSYWLLDNIVFQPKHRLKFAMAFETFYPIFCSFSLDDCVGQEDAWWIPAVGWWEVAMGFLLQEPSFARKVLADRKLFDAAVSRLGLIRVMEPILQDAAKKIREIDEETSPFMM